MIVSKLNSLLTELDLISNESIYFFDEKEKFISFSSETKIKLKKIQPDAIYTFNNSPFILFFDLTNVDNKEREQNIHKQVWSFDQAPLVFVIKRSEVKIYNAFAYEKRQKRLQEITLEEGKTIKDIFSFWKLQSGETWKWLQKNYYESRKQKGRRKRVNQKLFDNIKLVRSELMNTLSDKDANTLILRLIFIRYLIDRDVKMNPQFIKGNSISEKRSHFSNLVKTPQILILLFEELKDTFNGNLFKEEISITMKQADYLSFVFSEKDDPAQNSLFDETGDYYFNIFDFNIIPVELISGIYETLIDPDTREADSAFYTPLFLVEYILSNTIDKFFAKKKNRGKSECKVFDASVGSGIFLVQSFRRMVEREKEVSGNINISKQRLADIAKNNLFGIDINPEALKVACFSIYIAILDFEDPGTIMDKFHFPILNLFHGNFFDTEHEYNDQIKTAHLDFIIGNPPWKNGSNDPIHIDYLDKNTLLNIVSDFQLAQSFILRTKDFSANGTKCALVVTSKAIYNINASRFKEYFLKKFYLDICFDLSPVRRLIFEDANNPAIILQFRYAYSLDTSENIVLHQSIKQNIFLKRFATIIFEKNDTKKIKQLFFINHAWMFKTMLYGNVLDYKLLNKLKGNSVEKVLHEKYSIEPGNGIHKGTPKKYFYNLLDFPILETKNIFKYYSPVNSKTKTLQKEDVYLEAGRSIKLFKGKKILLTRRPKKETEICVSLCQSDAVFRNSVYGIPLKSNDKLFPEIYSIFISKLFAYYQYLTTSNWGIYYPEINKKEYLSFPFVESTQRKELIQLVNQFLQPFIEHYSQELPMGKPHKDISVENKINEIINKTYQIKGYENDLIDYVHDVARYQFQESKLNKILRRVSNDEKLLSTYADVFFKEFEKIYAEDFMSLEIYNLNYFIALNFKFSKEKAKKKIQYIKENDEKIVLEKIAKSASISQISKDLFIQKDIKGFEENSFYIIKPNEYKCWHRALAWYDSAEIKEAIQSIELERFKN